MVVKDMLGERPIPVAYDRVPWAIYCHPEVAFAATREEAARGRGLRRRRRQGPVPGNSRAQIIGETDGLVKVIAKKDADGKAGQILGVHMVGPWVTEQLGQGYLAVNWEATVDEVAEFLQPHPSLSELFGETILVAHRKEPERLMADVTLPQLGETVTEGTITKWFKAVGDSVEARRAAVRGLDRQGRHGGAVAHRRHADGDPGQRGRHRPGRRRDRRGRRRCRRRGRARGDLGGAGGRRGAGGRSRRGHRRGRGVG